MSLAQQSSSKAFLDDLLNQVSDELVAIGYSAIKHVRLSYDTGILSIQQQPIIGHLQADSYQGLTRACYGNNKVMLKWELLRQASDTHSALYLERVAHQQILEDVGHLIDETASILKVESTFNPTSIVPITNSLDNKSIIFKNENWLFLLIEMPYFELGSVANFIHHNKNSLSHRKQLNQASFKQRLTLIYKMAQRVKQFHQAGWIHGDIKPSNFLLCDKDSFKSETNLNLSVYLNDFSNAKRVDTYDGDRAQKEHSETAHGLSGTPAYLAPECWQGERMTVQSDIYALGVTVFEILTEYRPYQVDNSNKMKGWAMHHCQTPIPLLPNSLQDFQPLIDKLLAKSTDNRFSNMEQVCQALEYYMKEQLFEKDIYE